MQTLATGLERAERKNSTSYIQSSSSATKEAVETANR
jgi:hypothetical protein